MEMNLDIVLNYIVFKFFVTMTKVKSFKNPNNYSEEQIESSFKTSSPPQKKKKKDQRFLVKSKTKQH